MSRVNNEFLFGASTGLLEHGYESGQCLVKLRKCWGKVREGIWEGAWSDGSKEWITGVQEEMDHKYTLTSTVVNFFAIATHGSPLILVLSQFDGRYFKGLHAQYSFRLHFRLHCEDCPDAEHYIIRAHGNYLMECSVSVELPDLLACNYVVYLKATGERDSRPIARLRTTYKNNADKRKQRRAEWEVEQKRLNEEFNAKVKAEVEKAAEAKKRAQEADDEALSKRTKEIKISEDKDEPVVVDEHHKGHDSQVNGLNSRGGVSSVRPRPTYDSACESTHSPVKDWEALYSSDGMARKPHRTQAAQAAAEDDYDSKEERMPEPWNAICTAGVRVYSKDENLDLRTVMEGGDLLGEGMGSKWATDHGEGQFNPGDGRSDDEAASETKQGGTKGQEISLDISKESNYAEEYTI
ncbi:calpain-like protein [Fusarium bulbicola]|nr:calpain-like protein [Fusarium bulbicola]